MPLRMKSITYKAKIERKYRQLPRYLVIPARIPEAWNLTRTTTVTGSMNGVDLGRRGLKAWGDGKRWFFEVPESVCRKAGVDTGGEVTLRFAPAEDQTPTEIAQMLATNRGFVSAWAMLPPGRTKLRLPRCEASSETQAYSASGGG